MIVSSSSDFRYLHKVEYSSGCWKCKAPISSDYCVMCPICGWYYCSSCGACKPDCIGSFLDLPEDLFFARDEFERLRKDPGFSPSEWLLEKKVQAAAERKSTQKEIEAEEARRHLEAIQRERERIALDEERRKRERAEQARLVFEREKAKKQYAEHHSSELRERFPAGTPVLLTSHNSDGSVSILSSDAVISRYETFGKWEYVVVTCEAAEKKYLFPGCFDNEFILLKE